MKKFLAIILVTVLTLSLSANVFAAENGDSSRSSDIEVHTIIVNTDSEEIDLYTTSDYKVEWNNLIGTGYSDSFFVTGRNFSFTAFASGNSSGTFTVELLRGSSTVARYSNNINTIQATHQITIEPNHDYQFKVTNNSTSSINVTIFFSWS